MAEPSKTKMRLRFSLKHLLLTGLVVAIAIAGYLHHQEYLHQKALEREIAALRREKEYWKYEMLLQRLASDLKVPTEALYHRYLPVKELHRMRVDALREAGVTNCAPIYALQVHDIDHPTSFLLSKFQYRIDDHPVSQSTFWEGYMKSNGEAAPSALTAYLRGTPEFRAWLLREDELRTKYLRPLLMRQALAPDPTTRYEAIEALLLLDDRSLEIMDVLRESIARAAEEPEGLNELEKLRFHDVDPVRAQELIDEFDLDVVGSIRMQPSLKLP